MIRKAVILFSGGIDSTVMLAQAIADGYECYALSINYHQRHQLELQAATQLAKQLGATQHRIVTLEVNAWGGSALTDQSLQVTNTDAAHLNNTYVPARNTIFLATAASWAEAIGAHELFFAANSDDYHSYPDCRAEYIQALQHTLNLSTRAGESGNPFIIHTPLIEMTKQQIIERGVELGVDFAQTFTCYNPDEHGIACGRCDACLTRLAGFKQAGITDPIQYATADEISR